tara:strand:+ start:45278 stop:46012 length:735 start_codon:yes stop_codon:yes gene_type:complete
MKHNGIKFEKQIVNCYRMRDFNNPHYMPGVIAATRHLIKAFPQGKIVHRSEISLRGRGLGEIKADLWIEGFGVSVKMKDAVQLSSAEGKGTAKILEKVYQVIEPSLDVGQKGQIQDMIRDIRTMPTVMVSVKNRSKAKQRKPKKFAVASDYDTWMKHVRPALNESLRNCWDISEFHIATIEEMLTGRLLFSDGEGVADYILTPKYFKYIDRAYTRMIADASSVDVRGKSRGGISSGVVRFDTKI